MLQRPFTAKRYVSAMNIPFTIVLLAAGFLNALLCAILFLHITNHYSPRPPRSERRTAIAPAPPPLVNLEDTSYIIIRGPDRYFLGTPYVAKT